MATPRIFTGKNVQEATAVALETLGAELEDVDIRVVNPGRPGIFGLGGALAEIEVVRVADLQDETESADEIHAQPEAEERGGPNRSRSNRPSSAASRGRDADGDTRTRGTRSSRQPSRGRRGRQSRRATQDQGTTNERTRRPSNAPSSRQSSRRSESERASSRSNSGKTSNLQHDESRNTASSSSEAAEQVPMTIENREEVESLTGEILSYLIASMNVEVDAYVLNDLRDGSLVFEIEGADAGLLIGRRGETLRDLQFVTRLLVSRQLSRRANIIIDVEQYQLRRATKLRQVAENAAKEASRGRAQALEPMSPDERRIVHMALSQNPDVVTESQGQGSDRHIVVKPR